ncbi:hypothetical protein VM1G_03502 [Cytospora mali]|uniref:Uncharacterized protein n=1 Tax=Cytospora mali TaxID=578113 RepID=A0A194VSW0_CYTMA|nr:hypothetical protein VM1G_03502 [Valsa mali]
MACGMQPFPPPSSPPEGQDNADDDGESLFEITPIYEGDDSDDELGDKGEVQSGMHPQDYPVIDIAALMTEIGSFEGKTSQDSLETKEAPASPTTSHTDLSHVDKASGNQTGHGKNPKSDTDTSPNTASEGDLDISEYQDWRAEQLRDEMKALLQDILDTLRDVELNLDTSQTD